MPVGMNLGFGTSEDEKFEVSLNLCLEKIGDGSCNDWMLIPQHYRKPITPSADIANICFGSLIVDHGDR